MKLRESAIGAVCLLQLVSSVSAQCQAITDYLDIPVPMNGDVTIDLDVDKIDCPPDPPDAELPEIVIDGGILTIRAASATTFSMLRFTVRDGAGLVFDMPETFFGPNEGYEIEDDYGGFMLDVEAGASATFNGDLAVTDVINLRSVFNNAGSIEFKGTTLFESTTNVFRVNSGTLKFREDSRFSSVRYLGIDNTDSGFVRFSKNVEFDNVGFAFNGANGAAVSNSEDGKVSFNGDASFVNVESDESGGAVFNAGKMSFRGKAYFRDNRTFNYNGGGIASRGTLTFAGGVEFDSNRADVNGGAISVSGGVTTFKRFVKFIINNARESGGAASVTNGGKLIFRKPENLLTFDGNTAEGDFRWDPVELCTVIYVDETSTVEGYTGVDGDICVAP